MEYALIPPRRASLFTYLLPMRGRRSPRRLLFHHRHCALLPARVTILPYHSLLIAREPGHFRYNSMLGEDTMRRTADTAL